MTDPVPVFNNTSDTIPAYGVMESTSVYEGGFAVRAPTSAGARRVFVNGPVPIPSFAAGVADAGVRVTVAYDGSDGPPAAGEEWGPVSGKYVVGEGGSGFVFLTPGVAGVGNAIRLAPVADTAKIKLAVTGGNFDVTSVSGVGGLVNTTYKVTLPTAGTWAIDTLVTSLINSSSQGAKLLLFMNPTSTGGGVVGNEQKVASQDEYNSVQWRTIRYLASNDAPLDVYLQACHTSHTFTTCRIYQANFGNTYIIAHKISPNNVYQGFN